ncbi:MFS transporter [Streptomyces malaysiensis]|uniref:Major facilitator superfamily protein n=1 Tax=Streptomyces malaysiensis TaxID=92644 RepID=A0A7X6B122_STRMQ|nr:MFS transporter [Streptomyces malaysiensis]NIY69410.1 major facilitator superfamily protein [Streptomyces malaysiensis]
MDENNLRPTDRSSPGSTADGSASGLVTTTGEFSPLPGRRLVFIVVSLSLLVFALDQAAVATALKTLGADLGVSLAWAGWTITVYAVGQILALPLGGRLSDQFGGRRVVLVAIGAFTVMSLACGLAQNIGQLLACRLVEGLACGALVPATNGIIAHQFGRDRDRALALLTSVFPVGAIVGPLLGGLFITLGSWKVIFLANLPAGATLFVAALAVVPAPPLRTFRHVDVMGILLLTATLLAGMAAIAQLGSLSTSAARPVMAAVPATATVVAGCAFFRRSRRHPEPVVPIRLLTGRGMGPMNLVNTVIGCCALGFSTLVPVYAQTRYALVPLAAGLLLTARAVCVVATSGLAIGLLRRTGYKPLLLGGMSATVLGLVLTAVHPPAGISPTAWLVVATVVMGVGMGLSAPSSSNACMHLVPDDVPAVAGLRLLFRQIGGITTISVVTAVCSTGSNPGVATAIAFGVLAALMSVAILVTARLPNHRGQW